MMATVNPASPTSWLEAARSCRQRGDEAGEEAALRTHLSMHRRDLVALLAMGDLLARRGDDRGATSFYGVAIKVAMQAPSVPQHMIAQLRQAEQFLARSQANFIAELRDNLRRLGVSEHSVSPRVAQALRLSFGESQLHVQQPKKFYFPGLQQRPFFEREEFDWVGPLEAETSAIREELEKMMAGGHAFGPHVTSHPRSPAPTSTLLDDPSWSSAHLWLLGAEQRHNTERLPRTTAALAQVPLPFVAGFAPMVLFSLLRPGTRIPPHHGVTNTRLICHLPILAPDGCALRVGGEIRPFVAGRTLIFDDSFEHEAWNEGPGTRVVLLFEIWRPDISPAEREELTAFFEAANIGGADDPHAQ